MRRWPYGYLTDLTKRVAARMAEHLILKTSHKAVAEYYAALESYRRQDVEHEGAVSTAFQSLLDKCGHKVGWTLIPQQLLEVKGRKIRPDGTLQDDYYMKRGFWEAKDSRDNLETEIRKKISNGYPLTNIIFEDTRQAYLYQNSDQVMIADLTDRQALCDLLNAFFAWTEPAHEDFNKAIDEFKERVPDLARGLVEKIREAHKSNSKFIEAFDNFFELCRSSLNPNLSEAAVDEMLVQHLLTERLIRTIFDAGDFRERNVVAREVERVIAALTSESFSRHDFLQTLDRFYLAIESAANTITDFSEKQHFLNTVYERFFQGYSVKVADTHGIVYTPQEIVDFMCASVEQVLQAEFGKRLGSPGVNILDPCTGTGNFVVNLLRRVSKRDLPRVYSQQLFANEVMLLPYYIAALNIEHAYWERSGSYEPFEGLCFVDTLDLAEKQQQTFAFMSEENTKRVERQKKTPITVVIGNPPYNFRQLNENDNNKNRDYEVVDRRIKNTYAKASVATSKQALSDAYVKFFRWAVDRLEGNDGIICFVSNNSFVDQIPFDGMRKHLHEEFTKIFHVDLHGNVRRNPSLSGTTHNVFGIQVGVGITVAVRCKCQKEHKIQYHRVDESWRKETKLNWLATTQSIGDVSWDVITPDAKFNWLIDPNDVEFQRFIPIALRKTIESGIFHDSSPGVQTNRDEFVYDFQPNHLRSKITDLVEAYNGEVDRWIRAGHPDDINSFVDYDEKKIKWSSRLKETLSREQKAEYRESSFHDALYRPYTAKQVYFDSILNHRPGMLAVVFPTKRAIDENRVICTTNSSQVDFSAILTKRFPDVAIGGRPGAVFPFYVYDENGGNRRENITDWALAQFQDRYGDASISKWDIFYYVYGLLHHAGYRDKFADNLKRELPRIPLAPDFRAFADAGKQLAELHLNYESLEPYRLGWGESLDIPLSYRVEKMKLSKDKTSLVVNESLSLSGIPPEVFDYRLGNRSALDWVIDQYRVKTYKRSGITSDPNRADDPEYIVRLVGQVVAVCLETVEIAKNLPIQFTQISNPGGKKKKHK